MKVTFDLELYSEDAVYQSEQAFRDIMEISVSKRDQMISCEGKNSKYDPEQTMLEFGNYVLNLTVMKGGRKAE